MFREQFGWFTGKRLGRDVVRMNGRSPGFNADFQRFVVDDTCIIVLANTYAPTASLIGEDLAKIVFGLPYEVPRFEKTSLADASTLDDYVGSYKFGPDFFAPNGTYNVERKNADLLLTAPGTTSALVPLADSQFLDRPFWSKIRFEKDANGRVTHLTWIYGGQEYRATRVS
jgi:hypothetical protein